MSKLFAMAVTMSLLSPLATGAEFDYFHRTYADAEKVARKEGKPLYLHFTTSWCGWCRRIENDVYKLPGGKKALSPFVCATLDCTVPRGQKPSKVAAFNQQLMRKYGGGGYPFLVMVTADGDVLHKISGYKPLEAFKVDITRAEENFQKLKAFQAYAAKANKAGYEYNAKALSFYSDTGSWDKAATAAAAIKKLDPTFKKGQAATASYAILRGVKTNNKARIVALEDEVIRHDPKNAEGYLQKVLWGRAARAYGTTARNPDKKVQKAGALEGAKALKQLVASAEKVSNEANVYGFLGYLSAKAGLDDEAVTALEKAIQLEPTSRRVPMLKKLLQDIKKAKAPK